MKNSLNTLISFLIVFFTISICTRVSVAQNQTTDLKIDNCSNADERILFFFPSKAPKSMGLGIGVFGSESYCNLRCRRDSYGLGIQLIGQGLFQSFMINSFEFEKFVLQPYSRETAKSSHNGLLISTFGTHTEYINGVSFSAWMSGGLEINGLSVNCLWSIYQKTNGLVIAAVNHVNKVHGVQIGLFNKAKTLKGIQIGLWNVNDKRSLPLINWNFKRN